MDLTGHVLGGRYELVALLASGGMGQVWRGRDVVLARPVAVKVLRRELSGDPEFLARFRAEARHTAGLTHPNVATLHDYGEEPSGGPAYLVMELVEGESLSAVLAREGRLSPERTVAVLRQVAAALAAAHAAGVVHRDVKPGNVLVRPDGTVKLTDFGIARSAASAAITQTGQVIGTAQYLSPEQAQGAPAGPASDVYALGMVAYQCLTGRPAFDGGNDVDVVVRHVRETPAPLPDDVPAPLRRLVERALAKDPADRFADGAALLRALDGVADGLAAASRDVTTVLPTAGTAPTARVPSPSGPPATRVLPAAGPPAADAPAAPPAGPPGDAHRPRRRLLLPVAALAVAAVAAGLFLGAGAGSSGGAAPSTSPPAGTTTSAPASPATVRVVAEDLVGRPVAEVEAELTALGLTVRLRPLESADVPAGRVVAVDPSGEVPAGQQVTVAHAVAPPAPEPAPDEERADKDEDKGEEDGKGRGRGRGKD